MNPFLDLAMMYSQPSNGVPLERVAASFVYDFTFHLLKIVKLYSIMMDCLKSLRAMCESFTISNAELIVLECMSKNA